MTSIKAWNMRSSQPIFKAWFSEIDSIRNLSTWLSQVVLNTWLLVMSSIRAWSMCRGQPIFRTWHLGIGSTRAARASLCQAVFKAVWGVMSLTQVWDIWRCPPNFKNCLWAKQGLPERRQLQPNVIETLPILSSSLRSLDMQGILLACWFVFQLLSVKDSNLWQRDAECVSSGWSWEITRIFGKANCWCC